MYFWFGRFRAAMLSRPTLPTNTRDYHALRYAQEMAMVRDARSAEAAEAHTLLAEAHRQAMAGDPPPGA